MTITPISSSPLSIGTPSTVRVGRRLRARRCTRDRPGCRRSWTVRRSRAARADVRAARGDGVPLEEGPELREHVVRGRDAQHLAVEAEDQRLARPRRAATAFSASVSNTGWRSKVDRPITLSSSLVAVCCSSATPQLAVARLQLREQPHVLDRDHGLVGEGLEQLDLPLGEGTNLRAPNHDHAKGHALSQQRRGQRRAVTELPRSVCPPDSDSDSAARSCT